MTRTINQAGLALVKEYETLRLAAYLPTPDDVPTIGYGHTKGVKLGDKCSIIQAEQWLGEDLHDAEKAVETAVKVPLTDGQFSALVSFAFNVGFAAFRKSTLLKRLNAGDYAAVPVSLRCWVFQKGKVLNGLKRRREAEIALWSMP